MNNKMTKETLLDMEIITLGWMARIMYEMV